MPVYVYKARSQQGELKKGLIEAINEEVAANILREHGLIPTSIKSKDDTFSLERFTGSLTKIKTKEKLFFTRQLATMINAGLPIVQALNTLGEQISNKKFKEIILQVAGDVEGGLALSEALSRFPDVFPKVYIALVRSGEVSGTLDKVLMNLATQMEKDYSVVSRVRSAFYYPAFILVAMTAVIFLMMIYVIPQLTGIFQEAGAQLPITTRLMIGLSNFLVNFWYLVFILIIGAIVGFRSYINSEVGRRSWDNFKIKAPLIKNLLRQIYMERFTRTLGLLMESGLSVLDALDITSDVVGNVIFKEIILKVKSKVEVGENISENLKEYPEFPTLVSQMIAVGEETGQIDDICLRLSRFFEEEVDNAIKGLTSLIEPILMVFMGVAVGILVSAIIMPIYQLAQVIS
jgi:type IV pilus assembly protein PilC